MSVNEREKEREREKEDGNVVMNMSVNETLAGEIETEMRRFLLIGW